MGFRREDNLYPPPQNKRTLKKYIKIKIKKEY